MQIIKPSIEYFNKGAMTPTQFIEKIGRTCYKSTGAIKEGSDVKFVKGLCKSKHYAMIEHFWVHCIAQCTYKEFMEDLEYFATHVTAEWGREGDLLKHIEITDRGNHIYISMPIRVAVEMIDKQYASEYWDGHTHFQFLTTCAGKYPVFFPENVATSSEGTFKFYEENDFCNLLWDSMKQFSDAIRTREVMKHKTHTVLFITDRGVTHELVRHRPASFAQESQRYCNYSKDKFGGDITFIEPFFFTCLDGDTEKWGVQYGAWIDSIETAEKNYLILIESGATPQEARTVLPNSTKTEIIVTANEKEWQHIVNLRYHGTTGAPHPQMKEIMELAYPELCINSGGRVK